MALFHFNFGPLLRIVNVDRFVLLSLTKFDEVAPMVWSSLGVT